MAQRTRGAWAALSHPRVYSTAQRLVGGGRSRRILVAEYVRPRAGDRLIDLGCGPGEMVGFVPEVEYVGVDISPAYIERARRAFGDRAEFHCADLGAATLPAQSFDIATAFGLLHHLEDDVAASMLRSASGSLADHGRLIALDNTLTEGQSPVARWLISRDRGTCVRTADRYAALAEPFFESVRFTVREDLLRIPYTHVILECENPRRPGS